MNSNRNRRDARLAHTRNVALPMVLAIVGLGAGCDGKQKTASETRATKESPAEPSQAAPVELGMFAPLPEVMSSDDNALTEEKIALGRMLYYDARLSKGDDISCNSCHLLDRFGAEPKKVSDGHKGQKGSRNSPTVYNAAGHFAQFWDGRAANVEEQAKGPVLNPIEMAMDSEGALVAKLGAISGYVAAFDAAFPEEKPSLTYDNMAKAIGAFERKLVTPGRWDEFLNGKKDALTADEQKGLREFSQAGCIACHNGAYLGGQSYQKLGNVRPWPNQDDLGRFEVTKQEADKMVFKVPSLRNVEKTAPYFHDGSVKDLPTAVQKMASHQLGRSLSSAQVDSIVTFLKALTGTIPEDYIKKPELPGDGAKERKPAKAPSAT